MAEESTETMGERSGGSTAVFRVAVEADRLRVVALLVVGVWVALVGLGVLFPGGLTNGDPVETAFQAFVGATITGVTLVVTLNQLVLSQEFGAVGDQRERMEAATDFRADVAAVIDEPTSPAEPSAFLRALVEATGDRARELGERADSGLDDPTRERVQSLTDTITTDAEAVGDRLDGTAFGTFTLLSAALDFDYSRKLSATRALVDGEADLNDEQTAAADALAETLSLFGPAREHFKTLYFQWELITLSQVILATALPSLLVSVSMVLFYQPGAIGGLAELTAVAGAVALALLPFLVLIVYVVRIATVTRRTLSIGPFTLR